MIDIRPATPDDAAAIAAIYAPYVVGGTVSFESTAPDSDEMRRRVLASDGLYPWLVVTNGEGEEKGVVGYAYANAFRDRPAYRYAVEVSIYLAGDMQQRGVGRRLLQALIDTLRAQGFTQAIVFITLPNEASVQLHESLGFRKAGLYREIGFKLGRWIDVGVWQRELNDSPAQPEPLRRFTETGLVETVG